jgi:hypothetical protein
MQYSSRVEIHNNEYDRLHISMAMEGFKRVLTAEGTGVQYHMPIGHYWIETSDDRWKVLEAAKRAALSVDPRAAIVVSGDGRIVFYGCPKVEQPDPMWTSLLLAPVPEPASPWTALLGDDPPETNISALVALMAQSRR